MRVDIHVHVTAHLSHCLNWRFHFRNYGICLRLKATPYPHVLPVLTDCGNSSESSCREDHSSEDCWKSGSEASDDSLYLPTPARGSARRMMGTVSPIDLPNTVGFIELPHMYTCTCVHTRMPKTEPFTYMCMRMFSFQWVDLQLLPPPSEFESILLCNPVQFHACCSTAVVLQLKEATTSCSLHSLSSSVTC